MAHPRKFVEKIAIHNQRQAEETRAFEEIMKEVSSLGNSIKARSVSPHLQYRSLPNVNLNLGQNHVDLQKALNSLGEIQQRQSIGDRSPMRERRFTGNRPMPFPKRNFGVDTSPYHVSPPYLSPPQLEQGQGWRRAVSDSSLHQTVMGGHHQPKEIDINKMTSEPKRAHSPHNRPRSCEVPSINMYPSSDQGSPVGPLQVANTGSLPDLTNLHIPSPLQTPIDTEDNQMQATSPPLYPTQPRQMHPQRRHTHSPSMDKQVFPPQLPLIDPNISPLELRLQQFQLYQQSSPNNSDCPDLNQFVSQNTTCSSTTMSPTGSTSMSPLFKNFPTGPMSPLTQDMGMKPQHPLNNSAMQPQHQDPFSMPFFSAGASSVPRMPYQSLCSQPPSSYGLPGFVQYYVQSGGRVPDLIVTEAVDEPQKLDFARDISSAMVNIAGGVGGDLYNNDDPLKVELDPLDMESLQMLSGQGDTEVADQATEDQFRMDRLAGSYGFP